MAVLGVLAFVSSALFHFPFRLGCLAVSDLAGPSLQDLAMRLCTGGSLNQIYFLLCVVVRPLCGYGIGLSGLPSWGWGSFPYFLGWFLTILCLGWCSWWQG